MKKTRSKKSRDTVPLRGKCCGILTVFLFSENRPGWRSELSQANIQLQILEINYCDPINGFFLMLGTNTIELFHQNDWFRLNPRKIPVW
jgi:hypothetical protein